MDVSLKTKPSIGKGFKNNFEVIGAVVIDEFVLILRTFCNSFQTIKCTVKRYMKFLEFSRKRKYLRSVYHSAIGLK